MRRHTETADRTAPVDMHVVTDDANGTGYIYGAERCLYMVVQGVHVEASVVSSGALDVLILILL